MITYITYADLAADVLKLSRKLTGLLPELVGVLGIARSGMLPATMLSELWHLPLGEVQTFAKQQQFLSYGPRLDPKVSDGGTILVVDDSAYQGRALVNAKEALEPLAARYKFVTAVVYRNPTWPDTVDLFARDVPSPRYFQWNLMQHPHSINWMMDIDGVLCFDPAPFDDDGAAYARALKKARPLHLPKHKIPILISMRLEKWRKITENWLSRNKVEYGNLILCPYDTANERRKQCDYGLFKGRYYLISDCTLFVESSAGQAPHIAKASGKPVICLEDQVVYQ